MKVEPYHNCNLYSSSSTLMEGSLTTGYRFYPKGEGQIIGVVTYSSITTPHTLIASLWDGWYSKVDEQSHEASSEGLHEIYFDSPYLISGDRLTYHLPLTVTISVEEQVYYTANIISDTMTSFGEYLQCQTSPFYYETDKDIFPEYPKISSFCFPIDPICIYQDLSQYLFTPLNTRYGGRNLNTGYPWSADYSSGWKYTFNQPCTVYGLRFFTNSTTPCTAKASLYSLWNTTSLGSGTKTIPREGYYDVLFSSPVSITESMITTARENSSCFMSAIYLDSSEYVLFVSAYVAARFPTPYSLGKGKAQLDSYQYYISAGDSCPTSIVPAGYFCPMDLLIGA